MRRGRGSGRGGGHLLAVGLLAAACALSRDAAAENDPSLLGGPHPQITPGWVIAQLVPSPVWLAGSEGTHFGLRWPIAPLLWAYRMPTAAQRLRGFVIDPLARVSGSVELDVTPWLTRLPERDGGPLGVAMGVRTTFPLVEHGEGLAGTVAVSWLALDGHGSAVYEAGLSTLFGLLGVDLGYAPSLSGGAFLFSARLRYF